MNFDGNKSQITSAWGGVTSLIYFLLAAIYFMSEYVSMANRDIIYFRVQDTFDP
jgi:hypothetical protein